MTTIHCAASGLLAKPKPILYFDACDLLDIVRCLLQKQPHRILKAIDLIAELARNPDCVQIVTSFVVERELQQNLGEVQLKAAEGLQNLDEQIKVVYEAWKHLDPSRKNSAPSYSGPPHFVDIFTDRVQQILGLSIVLDADPTCEQRALQRVFNRVRPSHKGAIKDSIHLELCQELVRQLQNGGYHERCFFVSSNTSDYWADKNGPQLHPDLTNEFTSLNLEFFGRLEKALKELGI